MRLTHTFRACRDRLCRLGRLSTRVVWLSTVSAQSKGVIAHLVGRRVRWFGGLTLRVRVVRSQLGAACRRGSARSVAVGRPDGEDGDAFWTDRLNLRY